MRNRLPRLVLGKCWGECMVFVAIFIYKTNINRKGGSNRSQKPPK